MPTPHLTRRTEVRWLALLLALAAAAVLALSVGNGTAAAQGNLFGAIAVDARDGSYGFAYNYRTRSAAEARAMKECRIRTSTDHCRKVVWVRNGCAAVAVRRRSGTIVRLGWGIGNSRSQAQVRARSGCGGTGCRVLAWTCTDH